MKIVFLLLFMCSFLVANVSYTNEITEKDELRANSIDVTQSPEGVDEILGRPEFCHYSVSGDTGGSVLKFPFKNNALICLDICYSNKFVGACKVKANFT